MTVNPFHVLAQQYRSSWLIIAACFQFLFLQYWAIIGRGEGLNSSMALSVAGAVLIAGVSVLSFRNCQAFGLTRRDFWGVVAAAGVAACTMLFVFQVWFLPVRFLLLELGLVAVFVVLGGLWQTRASRNHAQQTRALSFNLGAPTLADTAWLRLLVVGLPALALAFALAPIDGFFGTLGWGLLPVLLGAAAGLPVGNERVSVWLAFGKTRKQYFARQILNAAQLAAACLICGFIYDQRLITGVAFFIGAFITMGFARLGNGGGTGLGIWTYNLTVDYLDHQTITSHFIIMSAVIIPFIFYPFVWQPLWGNLRKQQTRV